MPVFFREEGGNLIPQSRLCDALMLPGLPHLVISLVGAGGKTTSMYRLADEYAAEGKRVIVTTSTRILRPDDRTVILTNERKEAFHERDFPDDWQRHGGVTVVGRDCSDGKLSGPEPEVLGSLAEAGDVLLVEADGAKCLPLKVPGPREPVIISRTHAVVACAGLDSLGQPWETACFRFPTHGEWAAGRMGMSSQTAGLERIGPAGLAGILTDPRGGRKGVGDRDFRILLNKADTEERRKQALETVRRVREESSAMCAAASFRRSEPPEGFIKTD